MILESQRRAVVQHTPALAALTPGRTGKPSVRDGAVGVAFAVTPTGVPYDSFEIDDVPVVGVDGDRRSGKMAPGSEVPMHAAIYRRKDVGAIVHTHSLAFKCQSCRFARLESAGEGVPLDTANVGTGSGSRSVVASWKASMNSRTALRSPALIAS